MDAEIGAVFIVKVFGLGNRVCTGIGLAVGKDDQGRFAPVGQCTIEFGKILTEKDTSGMQYYFVEQDMTFDGLKPLEAIKISHKGLESIGFN